MLPLPHLLETPSGKFMVWGHEAIAQQLFRHGQWEPVNVELAKRILARSETKDVVDVGANFGPFAVPVARLGHGLVHAFEPQRVIYQQLCGNAFLNGLDNLIAYDLALGNPQSASELIDFPDPDYSREINPGALSILSFGDNDLPRASYFGSQARRTRKVRYASLDSLNLAEIGLIKIDVEGAEELVIRGALDTLIRNGFPPILFEAWSADWYREQKDSLLSCLNDFGYEVTFVFDFGIAQHGTRSDRHRVEFDAARGIVVIS